MAEGSAGHESVATVLVVDDEPVSRRGLRRLLRERRDLAVIGECENGVAAVDFIERHHPDLVLLDVQMPGLDGLGVVSRVGIERMPIIIFVTAFDEHAIAAFELAAVDYIVKPFTDERLMRALDRARERRAERTAVRSLGRLVEALARELPESGLATSHPAAYAGATRVPRFRERFLVSIGARDAVVHASEISWIRANGYYASLVTHDRKAYLVRTPLDQLERELDPASFIRVHRSAIVGVGEVRGVERTASRGTVIVLRDGTRVPVSRSRREAALRALGAGL